MDGGMALNTTPSHSVSDRGFVRGMRMDVDCENSYNKYLAIAARAVRRSLKDGPRAKAERRGNVDQLKFVRWEV